jgi:methyl-accepting chemotaxis protein
MRSRKSCCLTYFICTLRRKIIIMNKPAKMFKINSIKSKLSLITFLITVVSLCTLGSINYWNAQKVVIQNCEDSVTGLALNNSEKLGLWVDTRKREMGILASSPLITDGNYDTIINYLKNESQRDGIYIRFLVADLNGNTYYTDGSKSNLAERPYFQQAKTGKVVVSDPVIAKVDGRAVIVIATPIIKNGSVVGVLGGTVTMDDLTKLVLDIKVGDSGYAYVKQNDGLTIMHPDPNIVMKSNSLKDSNVDPALVALTTRMVQGEQGLTKYTYNGSEKYVAFAPIAGTTWSLAVNSPVKEATAKLNSLMWFSVLVVLIILMITAAIVYIFAKGIAAPIEKLHTFANRIAAGDLSNTDAHIHSNDEIGALAESFKTMTENLRSLIRKVTNSAQQVNRSADDLTANSEQSAQAASQVAGAITDVAQGAEKQLNAVKETVDVVQKMTDTIQQVAGNANQVADKSSQTAIMANEGGKSADRAVTQMAKVEQTVNGSAQVVARLGERSQEIGQIVDTIAGIAGQTNLLALNAAIEAARAGEQGRGFAVVAEEVRKLAEQSQTATRKVAELISEIQTDTTKAVDAMTEGTNEVRLGTEAVDTAGKAFRAIVDQITQVSDEIKEISAAIQQMVSGSEQIVLSIKEIDELSKKAAGEAQTVSAATEEQSASMQEIAASSQHLAQMAQELQTEVGKFHI